ncbi:DNA replication/repair protein RecF [Thioalkalivibrio sp. ARh3]|uniref:DNA replication/repair protein RecF n=1 Tax=Thioalkalivibrio sp. ARh3 TaxID=1158148 RepID=UPI0003613879|nr:DNA replication and repair protein RecF [Thioalkalivibrio sp. ARh3]
MLEALWWHGVRNLVEQAFEPGSGINRLVGPNGAGKTSVLEACHVLAAGRSFRTPQLRRVVTSGKKSLWVGGQVRDRQGGVHRLGVNWEGARRSRLDGRWMEGHASVAEWLPVRVLHAGSFELLTGSPEERRRLLDWGCFHSEASYRRQWQQWRRAHEQRNAALRTGDHRAVREFERPLIEAGEKITSAREGYIESWQASTARAAAAFGFSERLDGFRLRLRVGWDRDRSLAEAIDRSRASDMERGFGQVGPQRADIELRFEGRPAAEASRGEQKRLIVALTGGQAGMLEAQRGRAPVVLLDDVVSELDVDAVEGLMTGLSSYGWQVLVTAVDPVIPGLDRADSTQLFHVEHGVVSPA